MGAAIAILIAFAATRSDRQAPLFETPLFPTQLAEVEQALVLWNVPYDLDEKGTRITVAASRKRDVLLRLMMAGVPRRYVPTSSDVLAAQDNLLAPESIVDDRRRAGIEGDLVSSLRRIDGISDASVVIAPGSSGPFDDLSSQPTPSASVQLIEAPGFRIPAPAADGVRRFVAAAYSGLSPDRVTVVDASGALLGAVAPADRAASRETRVQAAVQSALDSVLGARAAVVRVTARIVGTSDSIQSTTIVPHGLLDSEAGREHGTESGRTFDKEKSTRHYAYDTIVEKRATPADAIRRLSVAVFLDARRVAAAKTPVISALVRAAAGADLAAGDEVVVEQLPFAKSQPPPAAARPQSAPVRVVASAVALCVLVAVGAALWPRPHAHPGVVRSEAAAISSHLAHEMPHTAAYVLRGLPADVRGRVLHSCDPVRRAAILEVLEETADA